jgi:RHS repeat-associated protein
MKSVYTYNRRGQLLSIADPNNHLRTWVYDAASDWLLAETDALGAFPGDPAHSTTLVRDLNGEVSHETDAVGDHIEYRYAKNGRLAAITQHDNMPRVTRFEYDSRGYVREIDYPSGAVTRFYHDEAGRLYRSEAAGVGPQLFAYDAAGRLRAFTDRAGATTEYGYDAAARNIWVREPNWPGPGGPNPGKYVTFDYDERGQRLAVADSQLPGLIRFSYDRAGRLDSETDAWGHVFHNVYNKRGDLERVYNNGGEVDLAYDRDLIGRVKTVTDSGYLDRGVVFLYRYTEGTLVNNLYGLDVPAVMLESEFGYDPNDRLTSVVYTSSGATVGSYRYERRADGRIGAFTGDRVGVLRYDGLKQLVHEGDVGVDSAYDAAGNRQWRAATPPALPQVFDERNQLLESPELGGEFSYDANGGMIRRRDVLSGNDTVYTFDGVDRLVRIRGAGFEIQYLYDPDGRLLERRLKKGATTDTRRFRNAGRLVLEETDVTGNPLVVYTVDPNGRRLRCRTATIIPGTGGSHSTYYQMDGLGSVVSLTDAGGVVRSRLSYDAWGSSTVVDPDALAGSFRFLGGFQDEATSLIHFGVRWYAPDLGRWLSEDPLLAVLGPRGGGRLAQAHEELSNLYRYVDNDPVNQLDPFGLGKAKIVIRVLRWMQMAGLRGRLARAGGRISEGQAVRSVAEGGHVIVKGGSSDARRQVAKQIAEHASEEGKAIHHTPHGPGQNPHYHPVAGGGQGLGHVLYGLTGYLTVEHYLGDNWVSTGLDAINPLSLPRDVADVAVVVEEKVGEASRAGVTWEMPAF